MKIIKMITLVFLLCCLHVNAETLLVKKQTFTTQNFKTFGGKSIAEVKVGFESYGTLNAKKDNAILITHFFSGNSHAAGKYAESDALPGYWDAIIGPGKTIDTNKYFVISVDSLANANVHDGRTITTGPASINPATNKPYGLDFPVVTIRDFVNVQKLVLESLGIKKLHAVMGASMGSFQALEWAVTYPNWVGKLVHVIGAGQMDAWSVSALEHWALPIRLDKNWNNGDYYDKAAPIDGLTATMLNITQDAMHPNMFALSFPNFKVMDKGALNDIRTQPEVVQTLLSRAKLRAKTQDANHVLYLVRASQLFVAGHQDDYLASLNKISAPSLIIPASKDLLLRPEMGRALNNALKAQGKQTELVELTGDWGHLEGLFAISTQKERIQAFLEAK